VIELNPKEYYEQVDFSPIFEIDRNFFKFRQIRLLLQDNTFKKVKVDHVRTPEQLQKIMLRYLPQKAYYMVSRFLNPSRVGKRVLHHHDGIFLKQDWFVFDIDKDVYKNAKLLLEYLEDHKYEIIYMLHSGNGVHIAIKRDLKCPYQTAWKREVWYLKKNEELVMDVINYGVDIDACVINTRQIVKIPLTLSDGVVCKLLNSLEDIKKLPPRSDKEMTRIPSVKHLPEVGEVGGSSPTVAISNNILGMKDHFCIFVSDGTTQLDEFVQKILAAIKRFQLSDFFIFEGRYGFYAICLDIVHRNRLMKILRIFPKNLNELEKFGFNLLKLHELKWYIGAVRGFIYKDKMYSLAHYQFLKLLESKFNNLYVRNYTSLYGERSLKVFSLIKEDGAQNGDIAVSNG